MQFHLLAFEGPDAYARAGGLATRVAGLAHALADAGHETDLWFVGDPDLPGYERRDQLWLHRWCQWISRDHPAGVYDGEEGKRLDYAASLPPFLFQEVLRPTLQQGGQAVILAEEARITLWLAGQTVAAMHRAKTLYAAVFAALQALAYRLCERRNPTDSPTETSA